MTDPHDHPSGAPRDDALADLLAEAVSDVEPTASYAAIRARTARPARRRPATWAYAGGAVASVAAVLAVIAVLAGGVGSPTPRPGLAASPAPASPDTSDPDATIPDTSDPGASADRDLRAVYYVGDTPAGPRLYREFRPATAGAGALGGLDATPLDPDYRTLWPAGALVSAHRDGDAAVVELGDARVPDPGLTPAEARLAVQQVVYTVQAAYQARLPVRFRQGGADVDQVYGVDTSAPVAAEPALDVLSHVSISDPAEGNAYADSFTARGVANGYEGTVSCALTGADGRVGWRGATTSGWQESRLLPWTLDVDLGGVAAGTYTFACRTEDPSGRGGTFTDTRTVVVE